MDERLNWLSSADAKMIERARDVHSKYVIDGIGRNKIEAIKRVREIFGVGLLEAKIFVESCEPDMVQFEKVIDYFRAQSYSGYVSNRPKRMIRL